MNGEMTVVGEKRPVNDQRQAVKYVLYDDFTAVGLYSHHFLQLAGGSGVSTERVPPMGFPFFGFKLIK